jgi:copper/silver efflux system protein
VFGPDLDELQRIGTEVEGLLRHVPGTRSAVAERGMSGFYLDVEIDRAAAARYGLNVMDVQDALMTAIGGTVATQTIEGRERYSVLVRYPRDLRQSTAAIGEVRVPVMGGQRQIPLGQLATLRATQGPMVVKTENAFPVSAVYVDVEGRDVGGYVRDAQQLLDERLRLPTGYRVEWSGQFEAMERVRERLKLIVPITLALVFLLLFLHFRNAAQTLMVMSTLPFALVGGVWLLWLLDFNTSVAVWVGFIALAGLAAEMGVVMLIYLDKAFHRHMLENGDRTGFDALAAATLEGATSRVRPVLMTVVSDIGGLLPLLWVAGVGAATMRRVAAPVVGGLLSAMVLTLIVLPVVYTIWREAQLRGGRVPQVIAERRAAPPAAREARTVG